MKILFFSVFTQCGQPVFPRIFRWTFQFLIVTSSDTVNICGHYLCRGTAEYLFSEENCYLQGVFTLNLKNFAKFLPKSPQYADHAPVDTRP